ncbi:hypothetical protein LOK49_LG04G03269 [Camellia lanceoleosa]|uniref:Uncharacterized protein n=1 Tax=Camellia lanceoleosa TaxID=1840588 RepID=A0ACC0HV42_9ERIC|nr:hypothetical protein LOK49_LG04G03269 [Camellia lanceoleosa]
MAVEFYSENSGLVMSPRISFSYDLSRSDVVPVEQHVFRSNSGIDFDFCIRESYDFQESSSADELFSDGKIVPTDQIKKKIVARKQIQQEEIHKSSNDERLKEEKQSSSSNSKSFWRFKRSSSLNCGGSGYARSLCPLPLLSRSNSTGSATSVKRSSSQKQNSQKTPCVAASKLSQSSSSSSSSSGGYQRPPLKKSYGAYGNGVRISPVLNVPSGNLFGFGSKLFNGKDKNKKNDD